MATILFVDDDEMERYFAREVLEPRGHKVLYASDGETALRIYDRERVDVIVTDLAMPRLNGLRLIKQLRARDRHVPIIAASGINADQLDMAEDFGAFAVLQKPWDPRRFLDTVKYLMGLSAAKPEDFEEFERVWPTVFSDMAIDDEGRIVRTNGATEAEEPGDGSHGEETSASGPDTDETYDLGLADMDLEVEDEEDASGDTPDLEIGELELEDPEEP